jgi:hypothetical protein
MAKQLRAEAKLYQRSLASYVRLLIDEQLKQRLAAKKAEK